MNTIHEGVDLITLPGQFRLSFKPYVTYLKRKEQQAASSAGLANLYSYLIDQFTPTLLDEKPIEDQYEAGQIDAFFQLIAASILPLNYDGEKFPFGFGLPVPLVLFYTSPAFKQMSRQFANLRSTLHQKVDRDDVFRFVYQIILKKYYDVKITREVASFYRFQTQVDGLTAYYQISINSSFLEPDFKGELPPLQHAWVEFANYSIGHVDSLPTPLPLESFSFEGFTFFQIEETTEAETLVQLQNVFVHLQSESESVIYGRFEHALRNLCGQPNLQIGLVPFLKVNERYVYYPPYSGRSIFENQRDGNGRLMESTTQQQLTRQSTGRVLPLVLPILDDNPDLDVLLHAGKEIRSLIVYPIQVGDELIGLLEIGSPVSNTLTETTLQKLEPVIPLIKELLLYQRNAFNARLNDVIKQQFTPLQPAVAWKFSEVAFEYLRVAKKEAISPEMAQVHFPGVYPLYGSVDIRNSSIERHKAIRQDFSKQLNAIEEILYNTHLPGELALPGQLLTTCSRWKTQLTNNMSPDDEIEIALFLSQEINPYFHHLLLHHHDLSEQLERYFAQTVTVTGNFNQALRAYELSQEWLNDTLRDYMEEQEKSLQTGYPHYFEKFRTDGLEYTLYAGQAITPRKAFEPDDLRHLRLWQLSSMIDMARLTHQLRPNLPLPLQTTQLILAHSQPVDLSFRQDERRFDVEGSYSIRYEVIKKRIDKAHIKDTSERLTQPDTIALVYANSRELADYLPLIDTFREQHKLLSEVTYLELEPLQGVIGLKALRLRVNYN